MRLALINETFISWYNLENSPISVASNIDSIDVGGIVVWDKIVSHRIIKVIVRIRTGVLNKCQIFLVVQKIWLDCNIDECSLRLRWIRTIDPSIRAIRNLSVGAPELAVTGFPVRTGLAVDPVDNIPPPKNSPVRLEYSIFLLQWRHHGYDVIRWLWRHQMAI